VSSTVLEQVRQLASDILAVPVEQIGADSSPEMIESWDSIQHLNLVLALEEKFHVEFSPEEMEEMRNLRKICELVETRLSGARRR
jgi:acyl carrier protein